jgi:hypothetical protein
MKMYCDECKVRLTKLEELHHLCKECQVYEDVKNFERIFKLPSQKHTLVT